jgi:glycerophosphoryl diester phosphodiesterase
MRWEIRRVSASPADPTGRPASVTPSPPDPYPVAHRAASRQAPENTRAAILRALELGFGIIELDVRLSRDGVPVLVHDSTLDRTTDAVGPVAALTAAELEGLDAGTWHDARFAGEPLITLADALNLIDRRTRINVDFRIEAAIPAALDLLRRADRRDSVVISGCTAPWAAKVRRLDPEIDLLLNHPPIPAATDGAPPFSESGFIADAGRAGAIGINVDHRHVTDEFCRAAHAAGLQVWTYTIDDEHRYRQVAGTGVDYITSNWPDPMLPLLNGRGHQNPTGAASSMEALLPPRVPGAG